MKLENCEDAKVIFFDQWFTSLTTVIMDLKKQFGDRICIIAVSENKTQAYSQVVDKFIYANWRDDNSIESLDEQYTSWLSSQIVNNNADIAFLRKYPNFLVKHEKKFAIHGCNVVFDFKCIRNYSNKSKIYERLTNPLFSNLVPQYVTSDNIDTAIKLLDDNKDNKLCLKLDDDEGGGSFRKICESRQIDICSLRGGYSRTVTKSEAKSLVTQASRFREMAKHPETTLVTKELANKNRIILMDYLGGPEVSVDCLRINQNFIAICRKKSGRTETIYEDTRLTEICESLQMVFDITGPFNAQFRYESGDSREQHAKLIDLNFRMSGGIYLETSLGYNLCALYIAHRFGWDCYRELLSNYKNISMRTVTHYETAIEIQ